MPRPSLRQWLGFELIEVSLKERLVAASGGALSLYLLIQIACCCLPGPQAAALVASMGASAVLLFAAPHGPLSQPWPVLAGHVLSALIGVACYRHLAEPAVAAAAAVGLAILVMELLKCIHPPGGATALTAVLGGDAIHELGYRFALAPVLANATVMVVLAVVINFIFPWRRYPTILSRPAVRAAPRAFDPPSHEEVLAAVRDLDSFVDISEEDLIRLAKRLTPPKA
jgi:CBS domain-containing membrane protein